MSRPCHAAVPLAASGKVCDGDGQILGFFVGTTSSLTLKFWDNIAASGNVILDTTTALTVLGWYPLPASFSTGLFVTFGGTGKITVVYTRKS